MKIKMKQVMDWKAALFSGIASSFLFYLLNIFIVPIFLGGNLWIIIRLFASIFLGEEILAPPATFDLSALIISLVVNSVLSLGFTFLIAFVFHKWGLVTGIIGGAFFGLGIYIINFYSLSYFFPWFFALGSWPFVVTHILFGSFAGGIYELLEVEKFEPEN
ncbi:MAG: hypothetical protein KDC88_10775, partial [Ignavibacteriae bacterium]|nr:hypothetical protein [Ignavibacteriota bacterium]MCB9209647.1 hypothetical protein [Ignavibacteriales bacterium]MCB9218803.1 hypothetical protein [Ignavibacteriales bacterium]